MALRILRQLREVATKEFGNMLDAARIIDSRRLEIHLIACGRLVVRYPREDRYSFHAELCGRMYRIDTAPHHRHLSSFPRHIHYGSEGNVVEDHITRLELPPVENFRRVLRWIETELLPACQR